MRLKKGYSDAQIRALSRWHSEAFKVYIRLVALHPNSTYALFSRYLFFHGSLFFVCSSCTPCIKAHCIGWRYRCEGYLDQSRAVDLLGLYCKALHWQLSNGWVFSGQSWATDSLSG